MKQTQLTAIFLNQSNDIHWVVDREFKLVYANRSYQKFIKAATGAEKALNKSAFIEEFGKEDSEKWKHYYKKALGGEPFEIENHFFNKVSNEIEYTQVKFEPLADESNTIFAVACTSRDVSRLVKEKSEVNQLMDATLDVFCSFDEDGKFVYVSGAAKQHWGYEPEELIGNPYSAFILEADLLKTDERATAIMNGKEAKAFINRYKKKDGSIAYNLWSATWNDHDKLMYAVARDGKEKIEAEEKLRESEQRFKALVQEGSDLIGILDTEGNYSYVSPTSISVLGIPPEEFVGKNAFDFIHPDDKERVLASLQKITTENKVAVKPFRFQNHKNEWRWVETVLTNMLDNPTVNGIVANSRDVTDKIEQEEKVNRTEKRFETLIQNSKDCIIIISPEGQTKFISAGIKGMLGYSQSEAMKMNIWESIHPQDVKASQVVLSQVMENPGVSIKGHTSRIKHKDGSWRWVEPIVTNLIHDPSIGGIVDVFRDVTKQKTEKLEKGLVNEINNIFNQEEENDLTIILSKVCEQIVRFGDFSFAEIWLPAFDKKTLSQKANFAGNKAGKMFHKASTKENTIGIQSGLSDEVLKNKETVIWESDDDEWNLLRRKAAADKAGIKSLIAIPLLHNDELLGGLLIGTKKPKSALSINLDMFQKLTLTLGSELSRKKTEIELNQIFSFTPNMICVAGFDGYFRKVNPAGLTLLGYSLEELLSRPIKSFVHEEDQSQTEKTQNNLYSGGNVTNFENRYITKEGKMVWLSWTATSLPEQGVIFAIAKDITEEKNLRELNWQVGKLAKIGSWEMNLVDQRLFWSDEVHRIYETDPNSFVPTVDAAIDFYKEDFRELAMSRFQECIDTGSSYSIEAVVITSKKNEIWVRTTAKAEFVDGVCTRVYGSFQDINEKKVATLELERSLKSLKDYKFALDQSAIIAFTDKKGVITSVNDNFCEISKYERKEIIGKTHKLVNSNYHPKEFFKTLWKTISSGKVWRGEIKNKTKDGSYYWVDTTIVPFLNKQNKANQYLAIRFDITARKKAEEERQRFQTTIENSLNEIYTFDTETLQFIYVNEGARLNLGYSATEIKSLTPLELKPEFNPSSFKQLIAPLINNEQEKIIFFTYHQRKDGSTYPVEVHLQLVSEGNDRRFLAIVLDITRRKKIGEENKFKANLLSMIGQATIATDLNGVVSFWNQAAEKIYGWKSEEAIGKNIIELTPINYNKKDALQIMKVLQKGRTWSGEFEVKKKDGTIFPANISNSPIYDEKGKLSGIIGISSDITKEIENKKLLKQYTKELERSNEELEQFAFIASHDLQEPLRMVSGFMDQLNRKYGDQLDEKAHQYIHFATDGAKRMKQIILDLLDYSRSTRLNETKEEVNLNEIVAEFRQLRRKLVSEKKATIEYSSLPTLQTYKAAITQIFHCLLDNALKYTQNNDPVKVQIKAVEKKNEWEFSIEDNGIGIESKFYDKIFVIFQRLHNKEEFGGTGIGLSIVKKHVEFLGGHIWLESALDKGTTFYFTIAKNKKA